HTRFSRDWSSDVCSSDLVERVWEEISYAAFADPVEAYDEDGNVLPPAQIPERLRRAMTKYKEGEHGVEIAFGSKDAALEKLMRLHRMTDNDKMVLVNGEEFLRAMEEGRARAAGRSKERAPPRRGSRQDVHPAGSRACARAVGLLRRPAGVRAVRVPVGEEGHPAGRGGWPGRVADRGSGRARQGRA